MGHVLGLVGLLIVAVVTVREAQVQRRLRDKCRGIDGRREAQQQIRLGRSHVR